MAPVTAILADFNLGRAGLARSRLTSLTRANSYPRHRFVRIPSLPTRQSNGTHVLLRRAPIWLIWPDLPRRERTNFIQLSYFISSSTGLRTGLRLDNDYPHQHGWPIHLIKFTQNLPKINLTICQDFDFFLNILQSTKRNETDILGVGLHRKF